MKASLFLLLFLALTDNVFPAAINYPDFTSPSALIFQGDASLTVSSFR